MKTDIDDLLPKLQDEIQYCVTCQPYDGGDVVWVLGEQNDLESLFDEYEIPDDIRDEIANKLHCPSCGRQFERFDDYGAKTEYEKQVDQKRDEWFAKYSDELNDFVHFIEQYPYLGAKHGLGEKIINLLPEFPKTNIENDNWYRARKISDGHKFARKDMTAPNPEQVQIGEGRFNHYGQSHFYLAKTDIGAAKELLAMTDEKIVWMQNLIVRKVTSILDVRVGFHSPDPDAPLIATGLIYFSDALNQIVERNKFWKPEYFVPRFIADAAKLAGFEGILYTSNHHYFDNLVIFDTSKIECEFVDDPFIFTLHDEHIDLPF
ncbi:MAG: hypothetical protein FD146_2564 [Anaerolineaceae bacterium]|nr:MAG: hypothetical protein FD146_2564 [Anaerolineaceae bacterium]